MAPTRLYACARDRTESEMCRVDIKKHKALATPVLWGFLLFVVACSVLLPHVAAGQALTGALIGTVKDDQGGVLPGAGVRVSSPALIGGPVSVTTNDKGQLRFPVLPPGSYVLEISISGFAPFH